MYLCSNPPFTTSGAVGLEDGRSVHVGNEVGKLTFTGALVGLDITVGYRLGILVGGIK